MWTRASQAPPPPYAICSTRAPAPPKTLMMGNQNMAMGPSRAKLENGILLWSFPPQGHTWLKDDEATHCKQCEKEFSISRRKVHGVALHQLPHGLPFHPFPWDQGHCMTMALAGLLAHMDGFPACPSFQGWADFFGSWSCSRTEYEGSLSATGPKLG